MMQPDVAAELDDVVASLSASFCGMPPPNAVPGNPQTLTQDDMVWVESAMAYRITSNHDAWLLAHAVPRTL